VLGIVLVVVLFLVGAIAGSYNNLVRLNAEVDKSWGQVENQLQRRNDLHPNLVETVKGIAAQEQTVFKMIADARAQMAGARSPGETMEASRAMDSALGRLLGGGGELPAAQVERELPAPAGRAGRDREPHRTERMRYNEMVTSTTSR